MAIKVSLKTELAKRKGWTGTRRRTVKLADGTEKTFVFGRKAIVVEEEYPEILNDPMLKVVPIHPPLAGESPVATPQETAEIARGAGVQVGDVLELEGGHKARVIAVGATIKVEPILDGEPSAEPLPEGFETLGLAELRELASERGLATGGNTGQVLKRLKEWAPPAPEVETVTDPAADQSNTNPLDPEA